MQPTHRMQNALATVPALPRTAKLSKVPKLDATRALPAVTADPMTPALAAVPADELTPALSVVAADAATAALRTVAADLATATLEVVATEPTTEEEVAVEVWTVFARSRVSSRMGTIISQPTLAARTFDLRCRRTSGRKTRTPRGPGSCTGPTRPCGRTDG